MQEEEYDYFFKILVIGWDPKITNTPWSFKARSKAWTYTHRLDSGVIVKCEIWNYSFFLHSNWIVHSVLNASGAIIVYDIYNENSLHDVSLLLKKLKECTRPELIISLVENKSNFDENSERKVSKREGARFAEKNGLLFEDINWTENIQIEKVFNELIKAIYDQKIKTWNRFLQARHENN